jgi:hypothetical protein
MITPVRQASNNRRALVVMRQKLVAMECDWSEVDEFFRAKFAAIADEVKGLESHLEEFVKAGGQL